MATVFGCYQVNTGESRGKRSQREEKSKTIDTQSVTCLHTEIHPRPPRGEIQFPHHSHQAGAGRRSFVNGRWKKMQMQMQAKHSYCFASLDCLSEFLAYSRHFICQTDRQTENCFSPPPLQPINRMQVLRFSLLFLLLVVVVARPSMVIDHPFREELLLHLLATGLNFFKKPDFLNWKV